MSPVGTRGLTWALGSNGPENKVVMQTTRIGKCHRIWMVLILVTGTASVVSAEDGSPPKALEQVWGLPGYGHAVAADLQANLIYTRGNGRKHVVLDGKGKTQREFSLNIPAGRLQIMQVASGTAGILGFNTWGKEVAVADTEGKRIWKYAVEDGIDDAHAADLDGDGADEVIVCFNAGKPLKVLTSRGKLSWISSDDVGDSVSSALLPGSKQRQILATSLSGSIHVFSPDGKRSSQIETGLDYSHLIRVGLQSKAEKDVALYVTGFAATSDGRDESVELLVALTSKGQKQWSLKLPAGENPIADCIAVAPGRPWIAVGMFTGQIHVIDTVRGTFIASAKVEGFRVGAPATPEITWLGRGDGADPLLIVATPKELTAFQIAKSGMP